MVFRWLLRIIVPIVLFVAVLIFLANGIQDSSVEGFKVTGLSQIDLEGFVFDAQLILNNPSRLPVPVSDVVYNATLEDGGEQIGSGDFDTFILRPGESMASFSQRINWVPTVSAAADLVLEDEVWMVVDGVATIDIPVVGEVSFDFEDRIDIKEYVEQFTGLDAASETTQQVDDSINEASDSVENVSEGIGSLLG